MTGVRRFSAATLATLVLCGVAVLPATAGQPAGVQVAPEAYVASAAARALDLNLLGFHLTIGATGALIDSSPKAQAQGAGALLVAGTVADAFVAGQPAVSDPPPACVLTVPLDLVDLATACGDARAEITAAGLPLASAHGGVAAVDIGLSLLDPLVDQLLALVGNTIGAVTDPLLALLGDLLEPLIGALDLQLDSLVDDLIAGVQRATAILRVQVGTSASQTVTTPNSVTASAVAEGAQIEVLPGLTLGGAPLLTIIVGSARADLQLTRAEASTTAQPAVVAATFDPAIVRVRLGLPLLGDITEIPVGLGQPLTLLAGSPLESTISLGAGGSTTTPAGSGSAFAEGVSLQLLKGIGGGIGLELAHAEVAGSGVSATVVPQQITPPAIEPPPILPKTGSTPLLPTAGFGLVILALVVRRMALREV